MALSVSTQAGLAKQPVRDFITIPEAVEVSSYTHQYVRRLVQTGRVGALKFGATWMVHRPSLEDYMGEARRLSKDDRRFGARDW